MMRWWLVAFVSFVLGCGGQAADERTNAEACVAALEAVEAAHEECGEEYPQEGKPPLCDPGNDTRGCLDCREAYDCQAERTRCVDGSVSVPDGCPSCRDADGGPGECNL